MVAAYVKKILHNMLVFFCRALKEENTSLFHLSIINFLWVLGLGRCSFINTPKRDDHFLHFVFQAFKGEWRERHWRPDCGSSCWSQVICHAEWLRCHLPCMHPGVWLTLLGGGGCSVCVHLCTVYVWLSSVCTGYIECVYGYVQCVCSYVQCVCVDLVQVYVYSIYV